jgi:hypothetical protein
MNFRKWILPGFGVLVLACLSGCATVPESDSESDQVSTIPWNRPANWEGRGPLGGMMMNNGMR